VILDLLGACRAAYDHGWPLGVGHRVERDHEGAAAGEEDHDQREGRGGGRGESLFPGHIERCSPDHHHSETERSQRREPCGDAARARKDQSERCHDLSPRAIVRLTGMFCSASISFSRGGGN